MLLEAQDSQVVLVDYQQRLMPTIHEGEAVLANAVRLARAAHLMDVPLWATEEKQLVGPLPARRMTINNDSKMHCCFPAPGWGSSDAAQRLRLMA